MKAADLMFQLVHTYKERFANIDQLQTLDYE